MNETLLGSHAVKILALGMVFFTAAPAAGAESGKLPVQILERKAIARPVDHVFKGTIELDVEKADVEHKLFSVHERIPVQRAGPLTLLYPRWEAASHGPSLSVTDLAGLRVTVDGRPLAWRRDVVEPHAFHLTVPPGARMVDVQFQIVSADDELTPDLVVVPWQRLLLYPAGWYARNLTIAPSVTIPSGLQPITSLDISRFQDSKAQFAPVSLEALLDAPVYAARHSKRIALASSEPTVSIELIARRPTDLIVVPDQIEALRRMIEQARFVFGPAPYHHYTFIARMEDDGSAGGTEHRRSSEISLPSTYFSEWNSQLNNRDILPHEFVHSWNGLYRTPADLWAANPNEPQGGSLLWAYEGQTEFWGRILAARSGLRTLQETLDKLALDAAEVGNRPGRAWRPLADDVLYPTFMLRKSVPWRDWQRRRDYYLEGVMLWLDVDALLRTRSSGSRNIDDFARLFFAGGAPDAPTKTYLFSDIVKALNATVPYDWAGFLGRWIDGHAELDTAEGLARQGWRLVYADTASAAYRQNELELGVTDLSYSIGLTVTDAGVVRSVAWESPAYRAGMGPKTRIISVGGAPFTNAALVEAVRNAARTPIDIAFEQDGRTIKRTLDYRGPLRYPRLERIAGKPDHLTALLKPRSAPPPIR